MKENKVANEFNYFFSSIVTKLDAKILKTESQFHESLRNPNEKPSSLLQQQQKKCKTFLSS